MGKNWKTFISILVIAYVLIWFIFLKPEKIPGNEVVDYWLKSNDGSFSAYLHDNITGSEIFHEYLLYGYNPNNRKSFNSFIENYDPYNTFHGDGYSSEEYIIENTKITIFIGFYGDAGALFDFSGVSYNEFFTNKFLSGIDFKKTGEVIVRIENTSDQTFMDVTIIDGEVENLSYLKY